MISWHRLGYYWYQFFYIDKQIGIQISILGNITSQSLVPVTIIKIITELNSVGTAIFQNITLQHSLKHWCFLLLFTTTPCMLLPSQSAWEVGSFYFWKSAFTPGPLKQRSLMCPLQNQIYSVLLLLSTSQPRHLAQTEVDGFSSKVPGPSFLTNIWVQFSLAARLLKAH